MDLGSTPQRGGIHEETAGFQHHVLKNQRSQPRIRSSVSQSYRRVADEDEYDKDVGIGAQSDDEVKGRVRWIIRVSTESPMVGIIIIIFDVLRTIPITLDGFMKQIYDGVLRSVS